MSAVTDAIEQSFKSLVAEKAYKSITVKEICERAFISRRTFYANFIDKRAVVAYLLRRDAVAPVDRALELLSFDESRDLAPILIARFYQGILDEGEYYQNLVKPMAGIDPTFELAAARAIKKVLVKAVQKVNPHVCAEELDFVAYYHASAGAIVLERWICNGYEATPETLGNMHAGIIIPSLDAIISKKHML